MHSRLGARLHHLTLVEGNANVELCLGDARLASTHTRRQHPRGQGRGRGALVPFGTEERSPRCCLQTEAARTLLHGTCAAMMYFSKARAAFIFIPKPASSSRPNLPSKHDAAGDVCFGPMSASGVLPQAACGGGRTGTAHAGFLALQP